MKPSEELMSSEKIIQPELSRKENLARFFDYLATGGLVRRRWRIQAEILDQQQDSKSIDRSSPSP